MPRPGWVRVRMPELAPSSGTKQCRREFSIETLQAAIAFEIDRGLDRVIVVLPVW